jgi:hypothetical protein
VCQEEAWFDSVSILGSDSDEDFSSVNGGLYCFSAVLIVAKSTEFTHNVHTFFLLKGRKGHLYSVLIFFLADFPAMSNSTGTQLMQCEDASSIADAIQKFELIFDGSSVAQAVGQYLKRDANKIEAERPRVASPEACDVSSGKVEDAKTRNEGIKKVRRGEDACNTLKSFKDGEKPHESIFKSLTPVCTPRHANKVQPLAVASPRGQKKKSAVVRLSFKRQSFDGEQTTEICRFRSDTFTFRFQ